MPTPSLPVSLYSTTTLLLSFLVFLQLAPAGLALGNCDATLDLFVSEGSIEELSNVTDSLTESSSIFIIKNGTSHLLSNGYLQVNDTGQSLDPLPPSVDDITFELALNDDDKVQFQYFISQTSNAVSPSLSIPQRGYIVTNDTEFDLLLHCKRASPLLTTVTVQLNLTVDEACTMMIEFIIQKDCNNQSMFVSGSSSASEIIPLPTISSIKSPELNRTPTLSSFETFSPSFSPSSSSLDLIRSFSTRGASSTRSPSLSPSFPSFSSVRSSLSSSSGYLFETTPITTPTLQPAPSSSLSTSSYFATSSKNIESTMTTSSYSSSLQASSSSSSSFSETTSSKNTPSVMTTPIMTTPSISDVSSFYTTPSVSIGPTDGPSSLPWVLYVAAFGPIAGFLALCILIICLCLCCIRCAKKKGSQSFADDQYVEPFSYYGDNFEDDVNADKYKKLEAPISVWTSLHWGSLTSLPLHIQTLVRTINIDRKKIAITSTFLRGTHGCLNRGILMMDRINPSSEDNVGTVMKIMTNLGDRGHREDITHFIDLTTSMQGLEHVNILPLLGLSLEDNCVPIAIYPLTEYGNLHFTLEMCRLLPHENPLSPFTIDLKINFSYQLSSAMTFLADKKVILQDLALRNCWLDANFVLKLSDGALFQDFYPECYTSIKGAVRPVKWSAIETLQEGLITIQSNVWSFGVVVWEIFSVAKEPYLDIPNKSIISHLMMDGRLGTPSDDCPDRINTLLSSCWHKRGEERPRFSFINETLYSLNKSYSPSLALRRHINPSLQELTTPYSATTFGKESIQVTIEPSAAENSFDHSTPRHSNGNAVGVTGGGSGEWSFKRGSGGRRGGGGSDLHLSGTNSIGRGSKAEKLSLSFSILDDSIGSGEGSDEEGDGSFPSTLKSRVSVGTAPASSQTEKAESLATLQPSSLSPALATPTILPPASPDIAASTTAESASSRSSILMPAAVSTDRSSFYSTGIDSISTTFSTPLPHLLGHTPSINGGIEMKSYSGGGDQLELRPQMMTTPIKSTDSGIRSDEESSASSKSYDSGHVTRKIESSSSISNQAPPPAPPTESTGIQLRDPRTDALRNSNLRDSDTSRASLGLGVTDFSSELLAAFDNFSSFKS